MKIQYAILYMNVGQPSRLKYQWGSLQFSQWVIFNRGECTQIQRKYAPADDVACPNL
jgi:hypothetical protein